MQIYLYKNSTNTSSFRRNFTTQKSFDGTLKEGSDVLSPSITLEIDNPTEFNMMYIPDFKRYYFIGWENISNKLWRAYSVGIDTLFTYKNQILNLNAIIDKQEIKNNNLIDDGSYIRQVDTFPEVKSFDTGFGETPYYILMTAEGGGGA